MQGKGADGKGASRLIVCCVADSAWYFCVTLPNACGCSPKSSSLPVI